jgi:NAD(P)-dependent dehydrogenase (short-subunit alcohol dehydrogenase family)
MASLRDKVGVVTGGGTGIGKATALAMARPGADRAQPVAAAHVVRFLPKPVKSAELMSAVEPVAGADVAGG